MAILNKRGQAWQKKAVESLSLLSVPNLKKRASPPLATPPQRIRKKLRNACKSRNIIPFSDGTPYIKKSNSFKFGQDISDKPIGNVRSFAVKPRILLADSDREWLGKAKHFLEGEHYIVDPVTNGKDAQLFLYRHRYFAVILGLGLKNHSGIRVLQFISAHHSDFRVIAILEQEANKTEQGIPLLEKLNQYRIDNILAKSDHFRQLKEELDKMLTGQELTLTPHSSQETLSEEKDIHCNDDQFSKTKIEDFYISKVIFFDLFIRLRESHYIKVLHAGDKMEPKRLNQYRNNTKIKWFYFKKDDLDKYVKFQNFLAGRLVERTSDKIDVKLNIFNNVADKYWEQSFYEGINATVLKQGKSVAQNIGKLVTKEEHLMKCLTSYCTWNPSYPTHAFLVTLFATAIIKKFKWRSPKTMETVALACLLHDIGMLHLPPSLINKNTQEMTDEELKLYQKHPEIGMELIGDSRLISHAVKQIILQHHEYYDGTGYPRGKRRYEILIPANIVCLADDFVHTIFKHNCLPYQALDIFKSESYGSSTRYHPAIVNNFVSLFENANDLKKAS